MLKQIELKDIAVTTESEYVCQGEGEILKVCVEFEDTAKDLTVQIFSAEESGHLTRALKGENVGTLLTSR